MQGIGAERDELRARNERVFMKTLDGLLPVGKVPTAVAQS